jgi:hypothetical protein
MPWKSQSRPCWSEVLATIQVVRVGQCDDPRVHQLGMATAVEVDKTTLSRVLTLYNTRRSLGAAFKAPGREAYAVHTYHSLEDNND